MRPNRIKEWTLSGGTISAATNAVIQYSSSLNGEILEVDWNFNRAGSLWLGVSGQGHEFWRRNNASGTTWQHSSPRHFTTSTTGSIANADHTPFHVNGPVFLAGSGVGSGTQALQLTVRYR